jgi:hypothetical protein
MAMDIGGRYSKCMENSESPRTPRFDVMDDAMAEVLRSKTGAERLAIASGMYASARRMLLAHLHAEHPAWNDDRINREAARRLSHGAV